MPVLSNPRHEAFAQAIFVGLCSPNIYPTRGHAYNAAGYRAKDAGKAGGAAEVAACNLLKKLKSSNVSGKFKPKPENAPKSLQTNAARKLNSREATHTQRKPTVLPSLQSWVKLRFLT